MRRARRFYKLVLLLLPSIGFIVACGSGGQFPFDDSYMDDLSAEYWEGQQEADLYDKYLEEKWDSYAEQAEKDLRDDSDFFSNDQSPGETDSESGCPFGCSYPKTGCSIKGNISIKTGEKIYHVLGQYFYDETIIKPEYGERWFCTEQEAIANGWRKSKQ
jgi:hypothetical protein